MAIIMSLFSDAEMSGSASVAAPSAAPSVSVLSEPAPPQVVEVSARLGADWGQVLDPCVQCRFHGLCADDDCAMLLHPIDMPHAPTERGWRRFGL